MVVITHEGVAKALILCHCLGVVLCQANSTVTLEEAIRRQEEIDGPDPGNTLSRRRRYLVFPSGSSLQVVFCLTAGSYIGIADIFYLGATASLAWQLPEDPYIPYRRKVEALHRIDQPMKMIDGNEYKIPPSVGKNILINRFTGEPIQPFAKNYFSNRIDDVKYAKGKKTNPYHRKKITINPTFAKRSADNAEEEDEVAKVKKNKRATVMKIDRSAMHEAQEERKYLNAEHMTWNTIEFHRQSRSQLYEKIERLLRGMGNDGRHCVLKALCEIGQDKKAGQGSFLDEIMRAIFTLPSGKEFKMMHHQAYDAAHASRENCTEKFPQCTSSIKNMPLS